MKFLDALACKPVSTPPVWLMRQAGRYLPEYRALRAKYDLSTLFHQPDLATEVTLMPLRRFPLDAAIVFSDLLLPFELWGKTVSYPGSGGLFLNAKVEHGNELFPVSEEEIADRLSYVYTTIRMVKPSLSVPLLGFCGAPFTLLCYLLEGKGGKSFALARFWMKERSQEFTTLLDIVCDAMITYAKLQGRAGVDAIQIFDSWSSLLTKEEFFLYAMPYWEKMVKVLQKERIPVIVFARNTSLYPEEIASITPSGIGFDEGRSLAELRDRVPQGIAVQGNFSQELLATGSKEEIRSAASLMRESVQGKQGIIFNLGHGVLPHTPVENVEALLQGLQNEKSLQNFR